MIHARQPTQEIATHMRKAFPNMSSLTEGDTARTKMAMEMYVFSPSPYILPVRTYVGMRVDARVQGCIDACVIVCLQAWMYVWVDLCL